MSDKAILAAQLVDVRNVGQHKCIKLTLHVAAEQAGLVMAAFGWPTMVDPVPVAIARLNPETERKGGPHSSERPSAVSGHEPDKTPPASGPDIQARARNPVEASKRLAQNAGILCHDPLFQKFIQTRLAPGGATPFRADEDIRRPEILAAAIVRHLCKVESRSELIPNTEAGLRWELLESAFVAWRDVPEYADAS